MRRPIVSFSVLSDIHVKYWDTNSHQKLKRAIDDHHAIDPQSDLMVINGDLTNGDPRDYQTLQNLFEQTNHPPIHSTMGNHEYYLVWFDAHDKVSYETMPNGWSSDKAIQLFKNFTGYERPYHDLWIKGYHFIFLSGEGYRDMYPDLLEDAYISEDQFTWLEKKLAEKEQGSLKPIFLFLHQPLPQTLSGTDNPNDRYVVQHDRLQQLLQDYPEVICFSGHTHHGLCNADMHLEDGFTMIGSSAVIETIELENGSFVTDPAGSESLHVSVFEDHVKVQGRCHSSSTWIKQAQYTKYFC